MTQVKSNKAKVSVIGLGNIGSAVATNLVKATVLLSLQAEALKRQQHLLNN